VRRRQFFIDDAFEKEADWLAGSSSFSPWGGTGISSENIDSRSIIDKDNY
jgi:hypothetical protein